jgi:L-threonylcarbamoyladenylate synthase
LTASQPARSSPANAETLARAAQLLRDGGVVAFPTETVYGLGAHAENQDAVRRVFTIKGRPLGHPVIVHLALEDQMNRWAREIPLEARLLAERFWPGPLTLVLRRSARASDLVTGGQDTVALRVPSDPIAHEILRRAGIGVIAPSANPFGTVSATRAEHVVADFGDKVDLIIDGGPTTVGIESTIVSIIGGEAAILRPGGITREQIEEALHAPVRVGGSEIRVPGSLPSHYAPKAKVELFDDLPSAHARARDLEAGGVRVEVFSPQGAPEAFARELYERMREADERGSQAIVIVAPPEGGIGTAIRDRLRRAAGARGEIG